MKPLTKEERLRGRTEVQLVELGLNHTRKLWKEATRMEATGDKDGLKKLLKQWCFTDIYAIRKFGEFEAEKLKKLKVKADAEIKTLSK